MAELTTDWFAANGFDVRWGAMTKEVPQHPDCQFTSHLKAQRAKDGSIEWWYGVMPMPVGCHPQTVEAADALMRAFTPIVP